MPAGARRAKNPASVKATYWPPLVISVHGIRTHGEWQKTFASAMSGSTTKTVPFEYGRYGLLRFLTPPFNRLLVDRFYNWFGGIIKTYQEVGWRSWVGWN